MSNIAADLGSYACDAAHMVGVTALRCYDMTTQQGLGYAGMALFLVALKGSGRWA